MPSGDISPLGHFALHHVSYMQPPKSFMCPAICEIWVEPSFCMCVLLISKSKGSSPLAITCGHIIAIYRLNSNARFKNRGSLACVKSLRFPWIMKCFDIYFLLAVSVWLICGQLSMSRYFRSELVFVDWKGSWVCKIVVLEKISFHLF